VVYSALNLGVDIVGCFRGIAQKALDLRLGECPIISAKQSPFSRLHLNKIHRKFITIITTNANDVQNIRGTI
jgi:hypothetical protein